MNIFQKIIGHARTIHKHRSMVRKLCFKCGLYWQGITHDLSKYSPIEFYNGVKYYTGTASPHIGERKDKGYSDAWIHHHNRNKHHAEYWQDIGPDGKSGAVMMPTKYFKEMICDRVAASIVYLGDKYDDNAPLEYYLSHKDENQFAPLTSSLLESCLRDISKDNFEKALERIDKLL